MRISLIYYGHPNKEYPGGEEIGDTEDLMPIPRIGETVYSFYGDSPQAVKVVDVQYYYGKEMMILVVGEKDED